MPFASSQCGGIALRQRMSEIPSQWKDTLANMLGLSNLLFVYVVKLIIVVRMGIRQLFKEALL